VAPAQAGDGHRVARDLDRDPNVEGVAVVVIDEGAEFGVVDAIGQEPFGPGSIDRADNDAETGGRLAHAATEDRIAA